MAPVLDSIFIYPIKSCGGIEVQEALVTDTGLQWDRQWMLVNERGRFITQRQEPRLSLVHTSLPPEALAPGWACDEGILPPDAAMTIVAPGMSEPLSIPLHLSHYLRSPSLHVAVWEWSGEALDAGDDAAAWFSSYLQRPARLVRFHLGNASRPTDPNYAPGFTTAFTDGFPLLLISKESLFALNKKVPEGEALRINRFRPNLFVRGCSSGFEEDTWQSFRLQGSSPLSFHAIKPCSRCKVTTIEQETAVGGKEPLRSLGTFRRGEALGLPKPMRNEVFFGMNVVCDFEKSLALGSRAIRVGQGIEVLQAAGTVAQLTPVTSANTAA